MTDGDQIAAVRAGRAKLNESPSPQRPFSRQTYSARRQPTPRNGWANEPKRGTLYLNRGRATRDAAPPSFSF